MKRTLLATLATALLALSGCAHMYGAHAGHEDHQHDGTMPCCKGEGKEGEMCPLPGKDGAAKCHDIPCCAGKTATAPGQ